MSQHASAVVVPGDNALVDNPVRRTIELGQDICLDGVTRFLLHTDEVSGWLTQDGICGVVLSHAAARRAIAAGEYDKQLTDADGSEETAQTLERLLREDAEFAADLLAARCERSAGADGFVSVDIPPRATPERKLAEARRIRATINRPNIMIKVPATDAGIRVIKALLADGTSVNATQIHGQARYRDVCRAFLEALEDRMQRDLPLATVSCAATFSIAPIDAESDRALQQQGVDITALRDEAGPVAGRTAFHYMQDLLGTPRWRALANGGARPPRLVWSDLVAPDDACSDLKYLEALMAPGTVAALPPELLRALRHHGRPTIRLSDDRAYARGIRRQLLILGVGLEKIAARLQAEARSELARTYDATLAAIQRRRDSLPLA